MLKSPDKPLLSQPHALESFDAFPHYRSSRFQESVNKLLRRGFSKDGCVLSDLRASVPWDEFPRPFRFRLHAWEPIGDLLTAHSRLGDIRALEVAETYAFNWLNTFQWQILNSPPSDVISAQSSTVEEFAWYDMVVGLRIFRLAYLAETIIRNQSRSPEERCLILRAVHFHHEVLANPAIFRPHTNHGLYQALGQLSACRRLRGLMSTESFERIAQQRLAECCSKHFFVAEGVHREHSPGYHSMVLGSLLGAKEANLLGSEHDAFLLRAQEALMWMIRPDGSLAPIGDTDVRPLPNDIEIARSRSYLPLQSLLTKGAIGDSPPSGVKAYLESGYAFARIYDSGKGEPPESASYLAQLSAYHSRVHKHADHFTFVWSEGPLNILTDPGHFGYLGRTIRGDGLYEQGFWYSDPRRIYIESTRAHNCVEIDGRSYPRIGSHVFGSALKQGDRQGRLVVFDSSVTLRPSLLHRRTLILLPREFLLVVDWLYDRTGKRHDFRQWFQLAPSWSLVGEDNHYLGRKDDLQLHIVDVLASASQSEIYLGQQQPLQGWTSSGSNTLSAAASFNFSIRNTNRASFATLLSLRGLPIPSSRTRANASLSRAVLAWQFADKSVQIDLQRTRDELTVSMTED